MEQAGITHRVKAVKAGTLTQRRASRARLQQERRLLVRLLHRAKPSEAAGLPKRTARINALKWLEDFEDDPDVEPTVPDYLAALRACEVSQQPLERVWTLLMDMRKKGLDLDKPPHPRALAAVLRLGSLMKRRGRDVDAVVRRLAVDVIFEAFSKDDVQRLSLVKSLGAFTGEALRFLGIHTLSDNGVDSAWRANAERAVHRQVMLRRWTAWDDPEGPGDFAWLAYDLTCQSNRLQCDGEVVSRAPKSTAAEELFPPLEQDKRSNHADRRALHLLAEKLLHGFSAESRDCLEVHGVMMLYTPFPPETASIYAMQQFLKLFPWVEMHVAFNDALDLCGPVAVDRIRCGIKDCTPLLSAGLRCLGGVRRCATAETTGASSFGQGRRASCVWKELRLVMEFLGGGSMDDVLGMRRFLPETQASDVFRQIAEGLHYIHMRDIAHRDLKPENVLVLDRSWEDPNIVPQVKLADFGHSKVVDDIFTRTPSNVGTPLYMAPEAFTLETLDERAADLWSLGVLLFVILLGRCPFDGSGAELQDATRLHRGSFGHFDGAWCFGNLRQDLCKWMLKFRFSAMTKGVEVVAKYGLAQLADWDRIKRGHCELLEVMAYHTNAKRPATGNVLGRIQSRGAPNGQPGTVKPKPEDIKQMSNIQRQHEDEETARQRRLAARKQASPAWNFSHRSGAKPNVDGQFRAQEGGVKSDVLAALGSLDRMDPANTVTFNDGVLASSWPTASARTKYEPPKSPVIRPSPPGSPLFPCDDAHKEKIMKNVQALEEEAFSLDDGEDGFALDGPDGCELSKLLTPLFWKESTGNRLMVPQQQARPRSGSAGASLVIEEHEIEIGESPTLQCALEMVAEANGKGRPRRGTM
eukprot:g8572.t1